MIPDPSGPPARRAFARLCLAGLLAYCSYAICRAPLLPLFARHLGADAPTVGFVVGASTITGILLKLPAGAYSDVIGRRPLLVIGAMVFALMPFTYVGVASIGGLVLLRFVHGSATAIFGPVASASLSDVAPADRRATWLSTYSTLQGMGQAVGPVLAGSLLATGRHDLAFATAGAVALAVPVIAAGWPATAAASSGAGRSVRLAHGIMEVGRDPRILATSLAQAAQFALHGTLNAFLPLFATDVVGLGPAELGWLFGLQTIATLATRPVMGVISDRVGRRGVIATGLSVCSGAVLLVSAATGPFALAGAVLIYAAGVAVTTAATSAYVTDLSARARYGAAHGVFGTIYDVGEGLGPIGAGLLLGAVGYARMFQSMAGLAIAAMVVFLVTSRPTDGAMARLRFR
jgi:MFS family permease